MAGYGVGDARQAPGALVDRAPVESVGRANWSVKVKRPDLRQSGHVEPVGPADRGCPPGPTHSMLEPGPVPVGITVTVEAPDPR
jgi:hypothetical protein